MARLSLKVQVSGKLIVVPNDIRDINIIVEFPRRMIIKAVLQLHYSDDFEISLESEYCIILKNIY